MTLAQLIEFTADSRIRSRNGASLNIALTRSWQSSNVPSTATARTFGASTVVIWRRCTSLGPPSRVQDHDVDVGAAAHRLDRRRPGVAARGADDRDLLAALAEHVVEQPADELQGDVLERQRRAVEQLGDPLAVVDLHERDDGRVAERARTPSSHIGRRSSGAMSSPTNGRDDHRRPRRRTSRRASSASADGSSGHDSGTYRPPSDAKPGEQHVGEAERRAPGRGSRRSSSRRQSLGDDAQQPVTLPHDGELAQPLHGGLDGRLLGVVGDEHEAGVGAHALLLGGPDADAVGRRTRR